MDVDWKKVVGAVAPGLATALGGPLAGVAVSALSEQLLGRPDGSEAEVATALRVGGSDALLKLKDAEQAFQTRMRELPLDLAKRIYREEYWNAVRADELPAGIRHVMFDAAVNSGPVQAIKWLQRAVGASDDGVLGPRTLAAVGALSADGVRTRLIAQRLRFMSNLPNWPAFGRGWARRMCDLMEA